MLHCAMCRSNLNHYDPGPHQLQVFPKAKQHWTAKKNSLSGETVTLFQNDHSVFILIISYCRTMEEVSGILCLPNIPIIQC